MDAQRGEITSVLQVGKASSRVLVKTAAKEREDRDAALSGYAVDREKVPRASNSRPGCELARRLPD